MSATNWTRAAFVVLVSFLVQVTVLNDVVIAGVHPDVMVVVAAGAGLLAGAQRGASIGFAAGLVADLVTNMPFGLSALTLVLVGYGIGAIRQIPQGRDTLAAEIATCALGAAAATLVYAGLLDLIGKGPLSAHALVDTLVVVTLSAVVVSAPTLRALRWALSGEQRPSVYTVPSGGSAAG